MSAQTIGGTPVLILKEGTGRSTGKEAQRNNITAAKIIAETVRTTLGPRGMDKMLVSTIGDVTITNDGATIMKELDVQHPAAKMLVEVSEKVDGKIKADIDLIKIVKKHGKGLEETELVRGVVIDKEISHAQMPKKIELAKIALLNAKLENEKTEFDAKININNPDQMHLFIEEEEKMLKDMVSQIEKTGANVLFSEKGIDDVALHFLSKAGIAAIKNVSSGDLEKLSKATGGRIVASVKELTRDALGEAKLIEEVKIGDDKLVYVRDSKNPKAVTIVVRGGTEHVVDEADRSLHDALSVVRNALEDGKIVAGGGAPEAELAKRLREYAVKVGGREQLAIEAFAEAMEAVPTTLAENAGLDPIDILVELRSKHERATNPWFGVDVYSGEIKDMKKLNVLEPLRVKQQVVKSASEAASMILRIDDVIASKGVDKGSPGGGKDSSMPGGDDEY